METKKNLIARVAKKVAENALRRDANSTTCVCIYQPKIICFVDFLLGGITATLCISAGSKIRLQIVVILIPFATYLFLDAGWSLISDLLGLNFELSPFALAAVTAEMPTPEWAVCTIIFALLLISIGFGYFQVVKHELD